MKASPTERPDIRVPPPGGILLVQQARRPVRQGRIARFHWLNSAFPPGADEKERESAPRHAGHAGIAIRFRSADLKRTRRSWVGPALFMPQVGNSLRFRS